MSLLRGFTGIAFLAVCGCSGTSSNGAGVPAGVGGKDAGNGGSVAASGGSVGTGGQGSGGVGSADGGAAGGVTGVGGSTGDAAPPPDGSPCQTPGTVYCGATAGCVRVDVPDYGCGTCAPCPDFISIVGFAGNTCVAGQCQPYCAPEYHWGYVTNSGMQCILNDCPAEQVRCGASSDGGPRACVPWDHSNACGLMWPTGGPTCAAANPSYCQCCKGQGMCGVLADGGCQ